MSAAATPTDGSVEELLVYDERGLVPCVVQDWSSGEVLTLAYMNELALRRTRETGELHLWSRSRDELWHKGATSGNTQAVRALRVDCDGDALLALVEPAGPACHTGERTCFHRGELEPRAPHETLPALERTLARARARAPAGSYTVELLDDPARIGEKVMEEAEEVARAAREESDERVDEEAADLLYHLLVLLRGRGRSPRRRRAGARWPPSIARARRPRSQAREGEHNLIPLRETFIADCETPVSAFLKLRELAPGEPASCSSPPSRASAWGATRSSAFARARCCAGRSATGRPLCARGGRGRRELQAGADAGDGDVPPFSGGAVGYFGYDLVRTVEPLGEPSRTCSACPTWR